MTLTNMVADARMLRQIADAMSPADLVDVEMPTRVAATVRSWTEYQEALAAVRDTPA